MNEKKEKEKEKEKEIQNNVIGTLKSPKMFFMWVVFLAFVSVLFLNIKYLEKEKDAQIKFYKLDDTISTNSWNDFFTLNKDLINDDIHKYTENIVSDVMAAMPKKGTNYDGDLIVRIDNDQLYDYTLEVFYEMDGDTVSGLIGLRIRLPEEYQDSSFEYDRYDTIFPFYQIKRGEQTEMYFKKENEDQWYVVKKECNGDEIVKDAASIVKEHLNRRTVSPPWITVFGDINIMTAKCGNESLEDLIQIAADSDLGTIETVISVDSMLPEQHRYEPMLVDINGLKELAKKYPGVLIERMIMDAEKDNLLKSLNTQIVENGIHYEQSEELREYLSREFNASASLNLYFSEWGENKIDIPQDIIDSAIEVNNYDMVIDDIIAKVENVPYKYEEEIAELEKLLTR